MRITASGDRLISTESAILIGNHRTRTDWNFICSLQPQNVIRFKGVSKQVIQHIPFFGTIQTNLKLLEQNTEKKQISNDIFTFVK